MLTRRFDLFLPSLLLTIQLFGVPKQETHTLDVTVLINGRAGGAEVDNLMPDGRMDSTFEFNDRGRGPNIKAQYTIAVNGLPSRVDISGNDYLKAPVDEHFAVESGVARWKSTSENGK